MSGRIDWSQRAKYIRTRHQVEPVWANDAVADPMAYWLDPDPASTSGRSVRVIGYSAGAEDLLVVILLRGDYDPAEPADGEWWGVNAWRASARDRRIYEEVQHEQD